MPKKLRLDSEYLKSNYIVEYIELNLIVKSNKCVLFLGTVFKASFAASITSWFGLLVHKDFKWRKIFLLLRYFIDEICCVSNIKW